MSRATHRVRRISRPRKPASPPRCSAAAIERIAIVATAATNRMRIRRLAAGRPFAIFPDADGAATWLGWSEDYVRTLPWLTTEPGGQAVAA